MARINSSSTCAGASWPGARGESVYERRKGAEAVPGVGPEIGDAVGQARRLEQRLAPVRRGARERGDAGVADAAPRHADGAEKCLVVGRVGDEPEIGQQVLYLAALVEADRAHQPVWDAGPPERLLERARLRVGAVEHHHLLVRPLARARTPAQLADDPLGFVALVGRGEQRDRFPALPHGSEGLPNPAAILRDDAVRGVEDHLGGAVVLLQSHEPGAGEVLLELAHVAYVRPAPTVDRLVVVADRGDVAVRAEPLHEQILRLVRVLELVHQDELELAPVGLQPVGMLIEQRERMQQQIVEIHRVRGLERGAERGVDVRRHLGEPVELRARRELRGGLHPVLRGRDQRRDAARREQLRGMPPLLLQPLHQSEPVVLIVDREPPGEAKQLRLAPQEPRRERVERADPEAGRVAIEQTPDPLLHLAGRLVRERDREDPVGGHAVAIDQVGDPGGKHAGLARPRAREDQ